MSSTLVPAPTPIPSERVVSLIARKYREMKRSTTRFSRSRPGLMRLWFWFIAAECRLVAEQPLLALTIFAAAIALRLFMNAREARHCAERSRARLLMSWAS